MYESATFLNLQKPFNVFTTVIMKSQC